MLLTCGLRAPLARIRRSRGRYVASLAPCPPAEARRRRLFPLPPASPSAPSTSQHRGPLPCSRAPPLMTGPFPLCPSSPPSPLARKSFSPPARALQLSLSSGGSHAPSAPAHLRRRARPRFQRPAPAQLCRPPLAPARYSRPHLQLACGRPDLLAPRSSSPLASSLTPAFWPLLTPPPAPVSTARPPAPGRQARLRCSFAVFLADAVMKALAIPLELPFSHLCFSASSNAMLMSSPSSNLLPWPLQHCSLLCAVPGRQQLTSAAHRVFDKMSSSLNTWRY
ncbi:hypothetical protein PVAP13_3KG394654 [Panicum virgatum]|jgi:hypothetical protein|uniref:Uncharacterized protein n=1 Tax=Panicum virgatum TaxID=38727 RepID=A0A8T0UW80_PANVG|nr:hypothetical protein PVAP13_3KG394654 [Panicum virgatum]